MTKAYKLDKDKKVITIDDAVRQTPEDKDDIRLYVLSGYEIRHKSKAKSKQALKRADTITAEDIRKSLSADKEALKEFNRLISDKGFFSARKFYREYISSKTADRETEQKAKRTTTKTVKKDKETETSDY